MKHKSALSLLRSAHQLTAVALRKFILCSSFKYSYISTIAAFVCDYETACSKDKVIEFRDRNHLVMDYWECHLISKHVYFNILLMSFSKNYMNVLFTDQLNQTGVPRCGCLTKSWRLNCCSHCLSKTRKVELGYLRLWKDIQTNRINMQVATISLNAICSKPVLTSK